MTKASQFPDLVTHNYDPARGPGRNICHLPDIEAEKVLYEIRASDVRFIKPNYLRRRRVTEDWLIAERARRLGTTPLDRPIYFFLGDFSDGGDPSRPSSIVMPLSAFRPETLTFTYPDSMASLPLATRTEHAAYRRDHHGKVFTLDEIRKVVAAVGMPSQLISPTKTHPYDRFIEVQIWDDQPLRRWLKNASTI